MLALILKYLACLWNLSALLTGIGTTGDPTISSCTRTLNDMNVKIMCNYSINYQIHCTFSWNLTDSIINQGRVYPVACHVNDGVSTRTKLIVGGGKI